MQKKASDDHCKAEQAVKSTPRLHHRLHRPQPTRGSYVDMTCRVTRRATLTYDGDVRGQRALVLYAAS